tara:strand:- start:183 stop:383 length:201 start_codon:yes stop_codon:yes gene_type:complete
MMKNNEILKHLKEYSKTLEDIPKNIKTGLDYDLEEKINSIIYKLENYLDFMSDDEYYTLYGQKKQS